MMSVQWVCDSRLEVWLKGHGVEVEYEPSLKLSSIEPTWAKENAGRDGPPINDDVAQDYAELMASNSPFPPLVVVKMVTGYFVLDGKQRLMAATINDATTVAAFIVSRGSVAAIDKIQRGINFFMNGHRPDRGFQVRQALELMDKHGLSAKEAAESINIQLKAVESALAKRRSIQILEENKFDVSGANGILQDLKPLHESPKVLCRVFDLATKAKLPPSERKQLISDVAKRTGAGQLQAIKDWEDRPEVKAVVETSRVRPIDSLLRQLKSLKTFVKRNPDIEPRTAEEARAIEDLANWISGRLKKTALCQTKG
jgi:hypothetical protein